MDIAKIGKKLYDFCLDFGDMFSAHRHNNTHTAHLYVCGLMQADKRNMERMGEHVPETDYEALQHFISGSPWDGRAVMNRVAAESDMLLGGTGRTGLYVDETAFAKKGKSSVGVGRQWNGRLGKTDNSQVAVFAALGAGDRAIAVDTELFLPEQWTNDRKRCLRAGIPEERIAHRTKPELAFEIVMRQRKLGTRFDYVCADGLYGNSWAFCRDLDDAEEIFLVHVHSDQYVWTEDPKPRIPERKSDRGKAPSKLKAQSAPTRIDKIFGGLGDDDFVRLAVRKTTTGVLEVDAHRREVWVWDGVEKNARRRTLYIRRDVAGGETKYCLANTPADTPILRLAEMESQRFWIERAFEDAKSEVGMAEYQVRGWKAWHHHMALVMMAMLFLTKHRMLWADEAPLLSCRDIKVMLAHFLPRRQDSAEEMIRQMELRHAKRKAVSENAAKRQIKKRNLESILPK